MKSGHHVDHPLIRALPIRVDLNPRCLSFATCHLRKRLEIRAERGDSRSTLELPSALARALVDGSIRKDSNEKRFDPHRRAGSVRNREIEAKRTDATLRGRTHEEIDAPESGLGYRPNRRPNFTEGSLSSGSQ